MNGKGAELPLKKKTHYRYIMQQERGNIKRICQLSIFDISNFSVEGTPRLSASRGSVKTGKLGLKVCLA